MKKENYEIGHPLTPMTRHSKISGDPPGQFAFIDKYFFVVGWA